MTENKKHNPGRDIRIFVIGKNEMNYIETRKWLDYLGATGYNDHLMLNGREGLIGLAAKSCYVSFEPGLNPNVTKVRRNWVEYFDNILKSGHGSVLEHGVWTVAVEGCTRVFTAEMNRHRAGVAISERSMRYVRFREGVIPYWVPLSLRPVAEDSPEVKEKKALSLDILERAFCQDSVNYAELLDIWKEELAPDSKFHLKKQLTSMMRRIIGMGVCTGAVYTINIRAMRHILALRCSPEAEEEIAYVWGMIGARLLDDEGKLFGDFVLENGFYTPKWRKV